MRSLRWFGKNCFKVLGDSGAVYIENLKETLPVGKAKANCDARTSGIRFRKAVRLGIIDILQAVLKATQKSVGVFKFVGGIGR